MYNFQISRGKMYQYCSMPFLWSFKTSQTKVQGSGTVWHSVVKYSIDIGVIKRYSICAAEASTLLRGINFSYKISNRDKEYCRGNTVNNILTKSYSEKLRSICCWISKLYPGN